MTFAMQKSKSHMKTYPSTSKILSADNADCHWHSYPQYRFVGAGMARHVNLIIKPNTYEI